MSRKAPIDRMKMPRGAARLFAAVLAFLVASAVPAYAQSQLEQVERLTQLGRAEEARATLAEWWEGDRAEASRRDLQRGLWLRGRLTVDPVQAELDFQRLVVLYPSGQFTADAILRLAQASWAMGDEEAARRYVATLERDYAGSGARRQAVAWLADAGPLPPAGDTARRRAETADRAPSPGAPPRAGDPRSRDAPPRAVPTRSDPAVAASSGPPMNYFVQLGAFADPERAVALHDSVRAEGIDVRVVRVEGSRFTHVRVGRFAERSAAVELLDALTDQGINAALVRDDRPESPIRN